MSLQPQSPYHYSASHILDAQVARYVQAGWAVESRSETMAVLKSGDRPNHVLHLLITIFTCGFWAFVWFLLAVTSRQHRMALTVAPDGTVIPTQY